MRVGARRGWWAVPALVLLVGCGGSASQTDSASADDPAPLQPLTSAPSSAPAVPDPGASSPGVVGPSVPESSPSAAHANPLPEGKISGNLGVVDQSSDGSKIRLSAEIDGVGGWVVVQTDRKGQPGKIVGLVHRDDGVHDDVVVVPLKPRASSGLLWVTLYLDRGRQGVFEHPGADRPLQFIGKDLRRPVTLTVTG